MIYLALGAGTLVLVLALLRAFAHAPAAAIRQVGVWVLAGFGLVLALALLFTGRGGQVLWLLVLFGPLGWRAFQRWRAARRFAGPAPGVAAGESAVRTATLAMTLDHASGRTSGEVLAGPLTGRMLASLDDAELAALLARCRADDPESASLLEAWLARERPDWQPEAASTGSHAGPERGPMTRADAFKILGLPDSAGPEAIREAHRRLMQAAHPDRGGSDWLAARINEARDVLLP